MANDYIHIYIIARENVFYQSKICRAPYDVRSISINAGRALYGTRPGIGRYYHIQTLKKVILWTNVISLMWAFGVDILKIQFRGLLNSCILNFSIILYY